MAPGLQLAPADLYDLRAGVLTFFLMKIISGGQTGADRAALDAALELGFEYGGSVPKGRLAEDGPVDLERYPCMTELTKGKYLARTRKNVVDSDATLVFTMGRPTGGTKRTVEFARKYGRRYLLIDLEKMSKGAAVEEIKEWLVRIKPGILNVAGPKESTSPGMYSNVLQILLKVLAE